MFTIMKFQRPKSHIHSIVRGLLVRGEEIILCKVKDAKWLFLPGGHIEEGEESLACIMREAREEAGLETKPDAWTFLGVIHEPEAIVDFYAMTHTGAPDAVTTRTDEAIEWCTISALPDNALPNLHWLVPYARDRLQHERIHTFVVRYE